MFDRDWVEPNDPNLPAWPLYQLGVHHDEAYRCDVAIASTRLGGRVLYAASKVGPALSLDETRARCVTTLRGVVAEFEAAGYGPDVYSDKDLNK